MLRIEEEREKEGRCVKNRKEEEARMKHKKRIT